MNANRMKTWFLTGFQWVMSRVLRPINDCRMLMIFMLLMAYAITIAGNITGARTDPFLSTLLPIFDCYLFCLLSHGLKKIRMGFMVPILVTMILFSELFTVFFYHSNFTIYVVLLLFETNTQESREFVHAALGVPGTWYAALLTVLIAFCLLPLGTMVTPPVPYEEGCCVFDVCTDRVVGYPSVVCIWQIGTLFQHGQHFRVQ